MKPILQNMNTWLTHYLSIEGDDQETIIQKKIWWIIHVLGLPFLTIGFEIIRREASFGLLVMFYVFLSGLLFNLLGFHFYRRNIELWALVAQVGVVLICSIKVFLLGGLLTAGAPIYIGLLGPIYALVLPKKKRAIFVFLLYLVGMISATLLQPQTSANYLVTYYLYGFVLGLSQVFVVVYYFTIQIAKLKKKERERMHELDTFKTKLYTNITHEFRTPLTIILGMADQIEESASFSAQNTFYNNEGEHESSGRPGVDINESLKMIKRNGRKLLNLTNQMLDLSKLESNVMPINFIQGDIVLYLKYLVESFDSFAATKNINLVFSSEPQKIKMDFDPEKIQTILSNLISNAIKFTPAGGSVKVNAMAKQLPLLKNSGNGNGVFGQTLLNLSIIDTGPGITPEHLPHIFDRYYQIENNKEQTTEGTGLGLALTKELVILLDGEITVESPQSDDHKNGTAFNVILPITNQALEKQPIPTLVSSTIIDPHKREGLPDQNGQNGEKLVLLIAEDNPDVVQYMHSLLSEHYEIHVAQNGRVGLQKAIQIIPDIVISDVMMPVMDGLTFCRQLKNDFRTSHIPVVMLTAKSDRDSKIEGLESGADAYLTKPFHRKELLVRTKNLVELRQNLQRKYQNLVALNQDIKHQTNLPTNLEDTFLNQIVEIQELHLNDETFGIPEMCRELGVSKTQLYRKFKALTDTSVHQFLRNIRLYKAKEMLLTTDKNITEVAIDTGFKNLSHFSRIFSEHYGVSPSKVR